MKFIRLFNNRFFLTLILIIVVSSTFIICSVKRSSNNIRQANIDKDNIEKNDNIEESKSSFIKLRWKFKTEGYFILASPIINGDTVYFATSGDGEGYGSYLYAINTNTGELKWFVEPKVGDIACGCYAPNPFFYEDLIYFADESFVYCASPETSKIKWNFEFPKGYSPVSPPKVYKNRVYVGFKSPPENDYNGIEILDAKNGKHICTVKVIKEWNVAPYCFELKGNILYIFGDTSIELISIDTLKKVKEISFEDRINEYEASDRFLCISLKYIPTFLVFDLTTGEKLWEFKGKPSEEVWVFSDITIFDNIVYFSSSAAGNSILYATNLETGEILWTQEFKMKYLSCDPIVEGHILYFFANDPPFSRKETEKPQTFFYAIKPESGELIWEQKLDAEIEVRSNLIVHDRNLYFIGEDGEQNQYLFSFEINIDRLILQAMD